MFKYIWRNTPPEVSAAIQKVWQREKELEFDRALAGLILKVAKNGLHKTKIAKVLSVYAEKIGES